MYKENKRLRTHTVYILIGFKMSIKNNDISLSRAVESKLDFEIVLCTPVFGLV